MTVGKPPLRIWRCLLGKGSQTDGWKAQEALDFCLLGILLQLLHQNLTWKPVSRLARLQNFPVPPRCPSQMSSSLLRTWLPHSHVMTPFLGLVRKQGRSEENGSISPQPPPLICLPSFSWTLWRALSLLGPMSFASLECHFFLFSIILHALAS